MLNYAIRLDSLPLQVVVTHDRLTMRQDSVIFARKCALRPPNVGHVALHFDAFVLRYERSAASHDDLEL